MKFVDTNIFLRFLTVDNSAKAQACLKLFKSAQERKIQLVTTEAIIAEITYVLSSKKGPYQLNHQDISDRLIPILSVRGLKITNKRMYIQALEIYGQHKELDFEDCIAIAFMQKHQIKQILSYDKDFDHISNIQRVEPGDTSRLDPS